ncbi:MAG TPA: PadR family transcriptional regulator [Candidatus Acidoferrales bacterium]|jgi:DNA-binding PadR family transcriptional regulator|nr:PadR family transcriptional regulator [Candidatus Acidoferrales bacterium]
MAHSPLLGYALLGLLHQQPLSGYDLRKIFASTPIGGFSDSPGAIYPALRRLQERGLVRGEVQQSKGLRKRRVFRITSGGLASFKAWQSKPIVRDDMIRRIGELLLRFAFMDQTFGADQALAFLREFARELSSYIPSLRQHLDGHAGELPLSGRLALESGIQEYEARLQWARKSIARYERRKKERL